MSGPRGERGAVALRSSRSASASRLVKTESCPTRSWPFARIWNGTGFSWFGASPTLRAASRTRRVGPHRLRA